MTHSRTGRERGFDEQDRRTSVTVQLEPVPELEWSLATEGHPTAPVDPPLGPAAVRRGWIHTAPEARVLALYRELRDRESTESPLRAPWWLRVLDRGGLASRREGFAFEDEVHAALGRRDGWVFVPWTIFGDTGYWEYAPSDREPVKVPTTVLCTDEHPGWLNVLPAHGDVEPPPVPLDGTSGLLSAITRIESW